MAKTIGGSLATGIALIACLLVTCLPSSVFRLNVCDCGDVTIESSCEDAVCPCVVQEPKGCGDCPVEPGEPEDACCTDLPLPDLLGGGSKSSNQGAGDEIRGPDFATPDYVPGTLGVRATHVRATGPPDGHRTLRALLEHRSIVLLI